MSKENSKGSNFWREFGVPVNKGETTASREKIPPVAPRTHFAPLPPRPKPACSPLPTNSKINLPKRHGSKSVGIIRRRPR